METNLATDIEMVASGDKDEMLDMGGDYGKKKNNNCKWVMLGMCICFCIVLIAIYPVLYFSGYWDEINPWKGQETSDD